MTIKVKDKTYGKLAELVTDFDVTENCDRVCITYHKKNENGCREYILLKSTEWEFRIDDKTGLYLPFDIWENFELVEEEECLRKN